MTKTSSCRQRQPHPFLMKFLPIASCRIILSSQSGVTGGVCPGHPWDREKAEFTTGSGTPVSQAPVADTVSKPEIREEREVGQLALLRHNNKKKKIILFLTTAPELASDMLRRQPPLHFPLAENWPEYSWSWSSWQFSDSV